MAASRGHPHAVRDTVDALRVSAIENETRGAGMWRGDEEGRGRIGGAVMWTGAVSTNAVGGDGDGGELVEFVGDEDVEGIWRCDGVTG